MKDKEIVKTHRLLLRPWTDEELQDAVYNARTAEEKKTYLEMLTGCRLYPTLRLWHTNWGIYHRKTHVLLGTVGFKGHPNEKGEAEIGYEIFPPHQMQGYGTEAVEAMAKWAFDLDGIYYLQAETEPHNAASQAMLEKLGFAPTGQWGREGPRYEKARPKEDNAKDLLALGVTFGLFGGMIIGNLTAGILIGAAAGVMIGCYLDAKDRRNRENIEKLRK